jgi:hypothetical protein
VRISKEVEKRVLKAGEELEKSDLNKVKVVSRELQIE